MTDTYTNAFINATEKKGRHIISITKHLGLVLLVRGLPNMDFVQFVDFVISIFNRRRIRVDFVYFVDFDF